MIAKVESAPSIKKLTLWYLDSSSLLLRDIALKYITSKDKVIECRLIFAVDLEVYERICRYNLFNLQPEVKGSTSGDFLPQYEINLAVSLQPDLLTTLLENAPTEVDAIAFLTSLNLQQLENNSSEDRSPLLNTESWLCLTVKQIQDKEEVSFKTFWNYVNFAHLNNDEANEDEIVAGVINFVQDYAETDLLEIAENATKDIINSVNSAFEEILNESFPELDSDNDLDDSILEEVIDYFETEGWSYIVGKDKSSLKLQHKGKNGQWKCIAIAREKEQEFIFYSVCPLTPTEENKLAIAELITKINYGLTVGNFDLDFATGTIRYKTSINVKGDYLSYEMIDNLIKTNVAVMDKYLYAILATVDKR